MRLEFENTPDTDDHAGEICHGAEEGRGGARVIDERAHRIADAAAERGAIAALVERPLPVELPQVVVTDALAALSAFAREWRRQFRIPVIGLWRPAFTRRCSGMIAGDEGVELIEYTDETVDEMLGRLSAALRE